VAAAVEPAPEARIEVMLAISVPAMVSPAVDVLPLNSDTGAVPDATASGVRLST